MYRSHHITADYEVHHEQHDTLSEAEDFARVALAEMGGQVEIYTHARTLWAEDLPAGVDMAKQNGVRPGIDFPGTIG